MKRQFGKTLRHFAAATFAAILALGSLNVANAADNTGTGDVAGDATALVDSVAFQLFSTGALTLVKTAFLTSDGSPIATGASVPAGTNVDFMIYVNNLGSVAVNDTTIQDVLDPLFAYQLGTIRVDNTVVNCAIAVCTAVEEAAIYAAASVVAAGTDGAAAGDSVSFDTVDTIDVGNGNEAANDQLNAAANRVLAVVITVQVL